MPEWYLLPYYAILRAVPNKLIGRHRDGDRHRLHFRPAVARHLARCARCATARRRKLYFWIFVFDCLLLGLCGAHEPDEPFIHGLKAFQLLDGDITSYLWVSRIAALYYFAYFLVITPLLGLREKPLPVPEFDLVTGADAPCRRADRRCGRA